MKATKTLIGLLCISLAGLATAEVVQLTPQTSTNVEGPYRSIDPSEVQQNGDATWFFSKSQSNQFFRLRIDDVGSGPFAPVSTNAVSVAVYNRAQNMLKMFSQGDNDTNRPPGDALWENAVLAPFVSPIFNHSVSNGNIPSLMEFKVVPGPRKAPLRGVLQNRPEAEQKDLGYILVATTEDNFPVVSFSNEGITPVEQLLCRTSTRNVKIVQFDNTLLVAEDDRGNMIANFGSVPFKIPPSALRQMHLHHDYDGDDDLGTDNRPRPVALGATPYRDYAEFKEDFQTNEVYQVMRAQRTAAAREQWDVERGIYPEMISLLVNETRFILTDQQITSFRFFSEDANPVRVDLPTTTNGLRLFGVVPGDGRLTVETSSGQKIYAVGVRTPGGIAPRSSFVPGPQPPKFWFAGTWDDQPKYHQLENDDWCPLVGCGPVAWSMLFAWFERHEGVKGAFGHWKTADAPANSFNGNKQYVRPVYDDLHELCDVICTAFSDQGATESSDMSEGGLEYTYPRKQAGYIRRSWKIKWTIWDDCPEDGALECAEAIKKGYPAVVGLGWLWHYALAYGYERVDHKLTATGPSYAIYRYLKCNMGWGNTVQWYNLCDTFFSSDFKIRNGPNAL